MTERMETGVPTLCKKRKGWGHSAGGVKPPLHSCVIVPCSKDGRCNAHRLRAYATVSGVEFRMRRSPQDGPPFDFAQDKSQSKRAEADLPFQTHKD